MLRMLMEKARVVTIGLLCLLACTPTHGALADVQAAGSFAAEVSAREGDRPQEASSQGDQKATGAIETLSQSEAAPALTIGLVESRIAALRAAGASEDDGRVQAYIQVRNLLSQSDSQIAEAQRYSDAVSEAPVRAAEIQQLLDESPGEFDPNRVIEGFEAAEPSTRRALARAEQRTLTGQLETLDRRLASRESTASLLRSRIAEIDGRLSEIPDATVISLNATPSLAEALQWVGIAERLALRAERRARSAELASLPERMNLMAAQRAVLAKSLENLNQLIRELEISAAGEVSGSELIGDLDLNPDDPAFAVAAKLIERTEAVHSQRAATGLQLVEVRAEWEKLARETRSLGERFATAQRVVEFASESALLGQVLLGYWEDVEDLASARASPRVSDAAGPVVISRIRHEQELSELTSIAAYVEEVLREQGLSSESADSNTLDVLQELVRNYRELLRETIFTESEYIDALGVLGNAYSSYHDQTAAYRAFLASKLMWIPNHPPLWMITLEAGAEEFTQLLVTFGTIQLRLNVYSLLFLLLAAVLLQNVRRLQDYQQEMGRRITRLRDDAIRFTFQALLAAMLRSLAAPLVIFSAIAAIDGSDSPPGYILSGILNYAALLVFALSLMRHIAEPGGIGEVHFRWPVGTMTRVREELGYLLRWWIPAMTAGAIASRLTPDSGSEVLGRILILVSLLMVAAHFSSHVLRELRATGRVWFSRTQNRLRVLLILLILVMIVALVYGHVYSLRVIIGSVVNSVWVGITLLLVHALMMRWLLIAQRRLRLQQRLAQRAQDGDPEESVSVEEQESSIGDISSETRQLLHMGTLVGALIAFLLIWGPLMPAFDALADIELWTSTSIVDGETAVTRITLATLIIIGFVGALTVFAARRLPALVEIILRSRTAVSSGARYTVSTLLNYLIVGTGIIAALSALGLRWEQLQWLVAALGVGIGFGLQEIVANFISGLIILFERPIRVGDIITIGDKDGVVTRIRIRATTLRDWDGKELLVPNREFITGRLLNWSLSDSQIRIFINVGIAYGSDVEQALKLLQAVVRAHPRTLDDPPPVFVFENFGDNSLELSARTFIASLYDRLEVMTELRTAIYRAFDEAGIVIAFPQRDVHLHAQEPLAVRFESLPASGGSAPHQDP